MQTIEEDPEHNPKGKRRVQQPEESAEVEAVSGSGGVGGMSGSSSAIGSSGAGGASGSGGAKAPAHIKTAKGWTMQTMGKVEEDPEYGVPGKHFKIFELARKGELT